MALALINGQSYDHANVRVNIAGVQVWGVKSISAKKTVAKTNNKGVGGEPVSRGVGDTEYESSITLSMVDVEKIRDVAPLKDITKIPPFPIIITFVAGTKVTTCTLISAEFTSDGFGSEPGNTDIEVELPLIIAGIQFT
jgi:hypothetical protein